MEHGNPCYLQADWGDKAADHNYWMECPKGANDFWYKGPEFFNSDTSRWIAWEVTRVSYNPDTQPSGDNWRPDPAHTLASRDDLTAWGRYYGTVANDSCSNNQGHWLIGIWNDGYGNLKVSLNPHAIPGYIKQIYSEFNK